MKSALIFLTASTLSAQISYYPISSSGGGGGGAATQAVVVLPNDSTGTTLNQLAVWSTSGPPGVHTINANAALQRAEGVVIAGAGTTGSATIVREGLASCIFDGATTTAHLVGISGTVGGDCTDLGSTAPSAISPNRQILGRVMSTNGSAGTYQMIVETGISLTVPSLTGGTAPDANSLLYDPTAKNYHAFPNGADGVFAAFPSSGLPTNNHLVTALVSTGNVLLQDGGLPGHAIGASFDGAGSALTVGTKTYVTAPYACTIQAWDMTVDTGTATIDVWKIATGTAIPTVSNTITASALPAIASGTALSSTTLTGWTTSVAANDIFGFNVSAVSGATKATLVLQCQ